MMKLLLALLPLSIFATGCPLGWEQYKTSCYAFPEETVSWIDGMTFCQLYGGALVEINDIQENNWLVSKMKGNRVSVAWTGGTERIHRGTWVWMPSQQPFGRFVDWYGQEPNGSDEDCLAIDAGLGYRWVDTSCTLSYRYICEMKNSPGGQGSA